MNEQQIREYLESRGYTLIKIKRWKNHDWIVWKKHPNITYGQLILTVHIEDFAQSSLEAMFP